MYFVVFLLKIMTVISRNQRYTGLSGKPYKGAVDDSLFTHRVALYLKIIITSSEKVVVPERILFGFLKIIAQDIAGDLTCYARRKTDKSLMIFLKKFLIDPRFTVKALRKTKRTKPVQILKSVIILGEQYQMMIVSLISVICSVEPAVDSHIDLTAYDRMKTFGFHLFIEIDNTIHNSVISYGTGSHAHLNKSVRKVFKSDGTVEETILRVKVQMNEARNFGRRYLFIVITHNEPPYVLL